MHALLILSLLAAAQPQRWRFRTSASPSVKVESISGSIDVRAGREGEVLVEAVGGRGAGWTVLATAAADGIDVRAVCERETCAPARIDFALRVPPHSALLLRGVDASISVSRVVGELVLDTLDGEVAVRGGGAVQVTTLSGNVQIDGAEAADVETLGGQVVVGKVSGAVRIWRSVDRRRGGTAVCAR